MKTGGSSDVARIFRFTALLQRTGWITPAFVSIDSAGRITDISNEPARDSHSSIEEVAGFALPGFINAHSHAFQYAMAGRAEQHPEGIDDDFWTWRELMYKYALALDPDDVQRIAAMAYTAMLKCGFTHVVEFQYLHHDKSGKPYKHLSEMSTSLLAAAAVAGIRITLVPVYYNKGGFGKKPRPNQARFCFKDVDQYLRLLEECERAASSMSTARTGYGVHSLRAAEGEDIIRIVENGSAGRPFHMHVAEQVREVEEAVSYLKRRPVEWVLENLPVNEEFHLVHCTHVTDDELLHLAQRRANVVLCPSTEANLGDGIFRLWEYASDNGQWSIGTDSHIGIDPLEEMRWLDYGQRLTRRSRSTFDDGATTLIEQTFLAGKRAAGLHDEEYFSIGGFLDAVVYRDDLPLSATEKADYVLPTLVYHQNSSAARGTLIGGQWVVQEHRHGREDEIADLFKKTMSRIETRAK